MWLPEAFTKDNIVVLLKSTAGTQNTRLLVVLLRPCWQYGALVSLGDVMQLLL